MSTFNSTVPLQRGAAYTDAQRRAISAAANALRARLRNGAPDVVSCLEYCARLFLLSGLTVHDLCDLANAIDPVIRREAVARSWGWSLAVLDPIRHGGAA